MTAITLTTPYAPQPVSGTPTDNYAAVQTTLPATDTKAGSDTGLASDQSGQGAGNGTGTGGAQLNMLLERGRDEMDVQLPTPESVVGAQTESDAAAEFLARQAQLKFAAQAAAEQRAADLALQRVEDAKAAAAKAAQPEFVLPNPVPTAPILKGDTD